MANIFNRWLPFAFIAIVFAGTNYLTVQQNYRLSANDPQKQIAGDIATRVDAGEDVLSIVPAEKVDLSTSLSPFIQVYDANFHLLAGNAYIENPTNIPTVPKGVLIAAQFPNDLGENSVTWQPKEFVRMAIDSRMFAADKGYVVVGRSLREVEAREEALSLQSSFGLCVALIGSFVLIYFLDRKSINTFRHKKER